MASQHTFAPPGRATSKGTASSITATTASSGDRNVAAPCNECANEAGSPGVESSATVTGTGDGTGTDRVADFLPSR